MTELLTRPLDGPYGLEVPDLDLANLAPGQVAALRDLWRREPLLLLRRQNLTEAELVAFSRHFGELEIIVRKDIHSPRYPEVVYISNLKNEQGVNIGGLGSVDLRWHIDQSYRTRPATGASSATGSRTSGRRPT